MQLLLEYSDESQGVQGLSLIPGSCNKLEQYENFNVPHIGWNSSIPNPDIFSSPSSCLPHTLSSLLLGDFYYVHSFVASNVDDKYVLATFDHPVSPQTAAIAHGNVIGFQFHPEKSGPRGYQLLSSVLS